MPAHTLRALCAWILVLAMTFGPKSIIQISAWAFMLNDAAAQSSFEAILAATLDGVTPCSICNSLAVEAESPKVAINLKNESSIKGSKCIEFENTFAKPPVECALVFSFEYVPLWPDEPILSKATPPPRFG